MKMPLNPTDVDYPDLCKVRLEELKKAEQEARKVLPQEFDKTHTFSEMTIWNTDTKEVLGYLHKTEDGFYRLAYAGVNVGPVYVERHAAFERLVDISRNHYIFAKLRRLASEIEYYQGRIWNAQERLDRATIHSATPAPKSPWQKFRELFDIF